MVTEETQYLLDDKESDYYFSNLVDKVAAIRNIFSIYSTCASTEKTESSLTYKACEKKTSLESHNANELSKHVNRKRLPSTGLAQAE